MNGEAAQDLNAELVKSTPQDFKKIFQPLTPPEQTEALQCVLKDVALYSDKVVLNIFELPGFKAGSQNRAIWLPGCNPLHDHSLYLSNKREKQLEL